MPTHPAAIDRRMGGYRNLSYPREKLYPTAAASTKPEAIRSCPDDFREVYIRMGWDGITEHFRCGWPRICRWIDECGGDELREARRAYVREQGVRPGSNPADHTDRRWYTKRAQRR